MPGDRNNIGGILGVDPSSYDKELARKADSGVGLPWLGSAEDTKVKVLREEDARAQGKGS